MAAAGSRSVHGRPKPVLFRPRPATGAGRAGGLLVRRAAAHPRAAHRGGGPSLEGLGLAVAPQVPDSVPFLGAAGRDARRAVPGWRRGRARPAIIAVGLVRLDTVRCRRGSRAIASNERSAGGPRSW